MSPGLHRRSAPVALLLCAAACAHGPPAQRARHRPVVVTLVVDQLAAWVADERLPLLPPEGGFARLRREGGWGDDMRYAHAITDTAPGHAALYTGRVPRDTGIVANETLDPDGNVVPFLYDPPAAPAAARLLTAQGLTSLPTVSLAHLDGDTLADRLRAAVPRARILSLSFKDRAAILPGGRHADASLWFDPRVESFVTSSAVASVYPAWVTPAVEAAARALPRPAVWGLLDPAFVAAHAPCANAPEGEADVLGMGTAFPHPLAGAGAFRASPFADERLLETGARLAADEGDEPVLFLEISLSSNALIGHSFGPESWESWDEVLRLDLALGRFFAELDAEVGPDGWSAILSADHGIVELPERAATCGKWPWCRAPALDRWRRPCVAGERISEPALLLKLQVASELALGRGRWVLGIVDPYVVLTPEGRALPAPERARLDAALQGVLARQPGVAAVFDTRAQPEVCPPEADDSLPALVCRSMRRGLVGDLYVVPQPGSFFAGGQAQGVAHGSPYLYDRSVPLLARIPGKLPQGQRLAGPVPFETFSRTAALALGIDFAPGLKGTDLRAPAAPAP